MGFLKVYAKKAHQQKLRQPDYYRTSGGLVRPTYLLAVCFLFFVLHFFVFVLYC